MFEYKTKGGLLKLFLTSFITSVVVGAVLFFLASNYIIRNSIPQRQQDPESTSVPAPQQISASEAQAQPQAGAAAYVARTAAPGVVGISAVKTGEDSLFSRQDREVLGIGSGVIVSTNGYILTNNHVAGDAGKNLTVYLSDGRQITGTTVWSEPVLDLAIVKIDADGLTAVPLGDADTLQVGETAIAIGNPLGLELQRTVTSGIISALNRTIKIETETGINYMEDLIQTDASINPGNSGGPLLNASGQVIGINTVKVASAEAIGFAIPVNVAVPIVKKYEQTGSFNEPYLGVFAYDKWTIPFIDGSINVDNGVYVSDVDRNGPAYAAGLKQGCIIKQVDGIDVNTMLQLRTIIYGKNPGDAVNVLHMTGGKPETVQVKLSEKMMDGLITR